MNAQMHADILSWSRSQGLFAGLALEGATLLRQDLDDPRILMGRNWRTVRLVTGRRRMPPAARSLQAVPPKGDRHRNRKKWRPQSEHRNGEMIQFSDFSTALRKPTPLNSIDLQYGQCGRDMNFIALYVSLRCTACSASWAIAGAARAHVRICSIVPAACWSACFAGGPNLLLCPHVRL